MRDPRRDRAWDIFKEHSGEIQNKQIAQLLDISNKTISGWKSKDKWKQRLEAERSNMPECSNVAQASDDLTRRMLDMVGDNPDLTDKQRLFCLYYVGSYNATQAAIKAGYSRDTAGQIGYQLLQKTSIQKELHRLKGTVNEAALTGLLDVIQELSSIAYDDIGNYLAFRTERTQIGADENGNPLYDYRPVVEFKDSRTIDTRNISEISLSDRGQIKLKLYNRDTALYRLAEIGLKLRSLEISLLKIEADVRPDEETGSSDSNFAEALQAVVSEVWKDYQP